MERPYSWTTTGWINSRSPTGSSRRSSIDPRFKASVIAGGGFTPGRLPPEVDPFNFAPRIRVPTLMVNGRADFNFPLETSQRPLFRLLGPPVEHKRHALVEGGHMPVRVHDYIKEILDWFDRYLGPVTTSG
jgi:pimeloyl-ACP methyl ester carboxylesterase